ncbi:MAG: HPr family phosphocarrier protein [Leptospiraceae bacterium]|nr:HPr family phosphocarrier protein [Leptospiraceae bacterium]MCP5501002.1 HPr family phosphocarrier protein [Leptospiraceae bacterium]
MHIRPASEFVKVASRFPCEVMVIKDDVEVNGKSIMGLMMLAIAPGDKFTITTEGEKEEEAMDALKEMIEKNFPT